MTIIQEAKASSDFKAIADLAHIIWTDHYTPIIGEEQVSYMLNKFQSARAIELQVQAGMCYYIMKYDKKASGYLSFIKKKDALFLSKLYVLHSARGKGVGKAAMTFVQQKAIELQCKRITLTVNKYNTNSISAYKKMGFVQVKAVVQDIGNGFVMDDYVLEKAV